MSRLGRRSFLQTSSLLLLGGGANLAFAKPNFAERPSFKPASLFLTWQQDPTSTMTVQWVGKKRDAKERPPLWYRERGEGLWAQKPFTVRDYPLTDDAIFRAELTGLKADTEYEFHVGLDSPRELFRTMPAKDTGDLMFISGGDSGTGDAAVKTNRLAAQQSPRFVVLGGDLAYENGKSPDTFLKFLENYSRELRDPAGRMIPMLGCLGNHEVYGGNGRQRKDAPFFYSFFDGLYPDTGYACLDFGDYLSLVMLDSNHTTPIAGEQTAWLDQTLKARAECPALFVLYHVPAYPSVRSFDGGASPAIREHWVPLFEKYNVDAVMEHHDHAYKRTHPLLDGRINDHGISFLGDGSWGKLRTPKKLEEHSLLAVAHEAYHLSVHQLDGREHHHIALSDAGKEVDRCTTRKRAARGAK